jgi:hypothetical protein
LTLNGRATVKLLAGQTLADTKIEVVTECDPVEVGEPTIKGLPEPLKPMVQLASRLRNQIKIRGAPLPEYLQKLASRDEHLPLFGHHQSPGMAAFLRKITLRSFTFVPAGNEIVVTGEIALQL